jgi:hypothetical protein
MTKAIPGAMIFLACAASPVFAQLSQPSMMSALPNVGGMSAGNAAGVLQYCMKNKLVSSTSAESVVTGLQKKPNVTGSKDFAAGAAGQVLGGKAGKPTSLNSLQPHLKSQACDMVLKQAKHLL